MTRPPPSTCPDLAALELALVTGEADDSLRRHLAECGRCRQQQNKIAENLAFIHDLVERLGPPGSLAATSHQHYAENLPGYTLLREIARGGQGVVFEGMQIGTKRRVAVKLIAQHTPPGSGALADAHAAARPRADAERRANLRLQREAEIAASLRHPGIITVYDTEVLPDGRFMIAMEYVDGVPLDEWAAGVDRAASAPDEARKAVRTKIDALIAVCSGLHFAHSNGVIHRDLKPANILVDQSGSPRIVDFGVARRLASEQSITRAGGFAGTLAYAAPEQVSGDPGAVDIRSDVYSLGLILYELLAGRRPYETDGSLSGAIANITTAAPMPLRTITPADQPADSDLTAIVYKALAKLQADRYQSAAALSQDLERWMHGQPVEARPLSTGYLLRNLVRRHRATAAIAVSFLALLIVLAGAMTWSSSTLARQRTLLAESLAFSNIERGRLAGLTGENARAESLIWPELFRARADPEDQSLLFSSPPAAMQPAWALAELYSRYPRLMRVPVLPGAEAVRFEKEARSVRIIRADGTQEIRSVPGGALVASTERIADDAIGPAVLNRTRTAAILPVRGGVVLLDLASGAQHRHVHPDLVPLGTADLNADGSRLVTVGSDLVTRLWQTEPLQLLSILASDVPPSAQAHFSFDGALLLAGVEDEVRVWSARDGSVVESFRIPQEIWTAASRPSITTAQLSADGRLVAVGVHSHLLVYSLADPHVPPRAVLGHRGVINWVEFSHDGALLLTSGSERVTKIWDTATLTQINAFELQNVRGYPSFADDGSAVAACDREDYLHIFETRPRGWRRTVGTSDFTMHAAAYSPDGAILAAAGADGVLRLWEPQSAQPLWSLPLSRQPLTSLSFHPQSAFIATASDDGVIREVDLRDQSVRTVARAMPNLTWISYSPDGRRIAVVGGNIADVYSADTGELQHRFTSHSGRTIQAAFAPDGAALLTVGADGHCISHDLATSRERFRTVSTGRHTRALCLSPDGALIITGSDDRRIRIFDAATGRLLRTIEGARQDIFGLAIHTEGHLLFSCGRDSVVQVWDLRTGRELATLDGHSDIVLSIALSPDGRHLATASVDRTVSLWDLQYYSAHIAGNAPAWRSAAVRPPSSAAPDAR